MTAARDRLPRTGWISTENTLSPGRGGFSVLTWERGTDLAQTGSSGLPEVENTYFRYSLLPSAVFFFTRCILFQGPEAQLWKRVSLPWDHSPWPFRGDGVGGQSSGHLRIALYTLRWALSEDDSRIIFEPLGHSGCKFMPEAWGSDGENGECWFE